MKILLTGANGYIGMRLLPMLLEQNHEVICVVRDAERLSISKKLKKQIQIIEIDFLDKPVPSKIPRDIDAAYYLLHSMSSSTTDFDTKEEKSAVHFNEYLEQTNCKQVIYLGGIANQENLSKHLESRQNVEQTLRKGKAAVTVLRAGIIVGSGSSSFEIIRDLCEKLPLMITPKWVKTKCQPIAIRNVIQYLIGVLGNTETYNDNFDIGGPDILTYKEMMLRYAKIRQISLYIFTVPIMSPKLSSYWLYFITSTSYKLALNLVDSMKIEVVSRDNRLQELLDIKPIPYEEAIDLAFAKIEQNQVASSWKDSLVSGRIKFNLDDYIQVPKYGCLKDAQKIKLKNRELAIENIWAIGGDRGWYYGDWMWRIRGFIDKLLGGVGLRRGRTHPDRIYTGDVVDFWRVLLANKEEPRLLLFAEMRVPGEAWLEFTIDKNDVLHQTATFRPRGILGRMYWYSMLPFHYFIFGGMIRNIATKNYK